MAGSTTPILPGAARQGASALPLPVELGLVGATYFLAGKLGLSLAFGNTSASAVWPATGIALAALIVRGYRLWPSIFVGAFLVNFTTVASLGTAVSIAIGNTLEAVLGAYLANRYANGVHAFDRAGETFRFVMVALGCAAVSATIGVATLLTAGLAGADANLVWLTWWLGDAAGALVLTPIVILWSRDARLRWDTPRALEAVALLVALAIVSQWVFGWLRPVTPVAASLKFLCTPLLIWAAFRFDQRVAATSVLYIATLAVIGLLRTPTEGTGWERNERLVLLQVFMAITAITTLVLASVVEERRRAAKAAQEAYANLRDAMAELEAFSHSMSHDLASPLGAVVNYVGVLEHDYREALGSEGLHQLARVRASAAKASGLLQDLRQFAWVERHARGNARVDMTSLAREALAEVQVGAEIRPGLQFQILDLPPAAGNAQLLSRVFINLLGNAAKFTRPREQAQIEVGGRAGEMENVYWVSDNGIGFGPQFVDSIFQPFHRLGNAPKLEGSGLGLAIVAKIIRKHGGRVWAESDGVTGAKFWFTLPNGENH